MSSIDGEAVLESCPVCGKPASDGVLACDCAERLDLAEFKNIIVAARAELDKARAFFAVEKFAEADAAAQHATELYDALYEDATALRIRIALDAAEFERAHELLKSLDNRDTRRELAARLDRAEMNDFAAKEHYNIALRSARREEHAYAIDEARRAVELAPYLSAPYRLLVKLHIETGALDDARHWFFRARGRFPNEDSIAVLEPLLYGDRTMRRRGFAALLDWLETSRAGRLLTYLVLLILVVLSWVFAIYKGG